MRNLARAGALLSGARVWFRPNCCAWPHALSSLDYNRLARLEAAFNDPHRAGPLSYRNRPNLNLVFTIDHRNLVGTLQLGHRSLGNEQRVRFKTGRGSNATVLTGSEKISGVRKQTTEPNRPGLLIDFAIGDKELALFREDCSVGKDQLQLEILLSRVPSTLAVTSSSEVEVLLLA